MSWQQQIFRTSVAQCTVDHRVVLTINDPGIKLVRSPDTQGFYIAY